MGHIDFIGSRNSLTAISKSAWSNMCIMSKRRMSLPMHLRSMWQLPLIMTLMGQGFHYCQGKKLDSRQCLGFLAVQTAEKPLNRNCPPAYTRCLGAVSTSLFVKKACIHKLRCEVLINNKFWTASFLFIDMNWHELLTWPDKMLCHQFHFKG